MTRSGAARSGRLPHQRPTGAAPSSGGDAGAVHRSPTIRHGSPETAGRARARRRMVFMKQGETTEDAMEMEKEKEDRRRQTRSLIWGLFLIALGSAFLLDRMGVLDLPPLGQMWPLIFIVISASQLASGRPGGAVMFLLVGLWFMACEFGWYGLTYHNSWPLLMVAWGIGIVIRAFTGEARRWRPIFRAGYRPPRDDGRGLGEQ
jgi:hypothetical protein